MALDPDPIELIALLAIVGVNVIPIVITLACAIGSQYSRFHATLRERGLYSDVFHPRAIFAIMCAGLALGGFGQWALVREGLRANAALGLPAPLYAPLDPEWYMAISVMYILNIFIVSMIPVTFIRFGWWTATLFWSTGALTLNVLSTIWGWTHSQNMIGGFYLAYAFATFVLWLKACYFWYLRNDIAAPELGIDAWHMLLTNKNGVELPANYFNTALAQRVVPQVAVNGGNVFTTSLAPAPNTSTSMTSINMPRQSLSYRPAASAFQQQNSYPMGGMQNVAYTRITQ